MLAGQVPLRVVGSLAGDFVKGVLYERDFPTDFLLGVRLHRRIDAFSNSQPDLLASVKRLPRSLRRFAPPCIDVLADHFLALTLAADNQKLPGYSDFYSYRAWLYTLLEQHKQLLSADAQRFFAHVKHTDLLVGYADWARLVPVIEHVCKRLRRPEIGAPMVAAMQSQLDNLALDFEVYWPALNAEAQRFISAAE